MIDLIVDREISDEDISINLSKIFNIPKNEVNIGKDIEEITSVKSNGIFVVRTKMSGDFPLLLNIYFLSNRAQNLTELEVVGHFCELLKCKCLISDESINPFIWILVSGVYKYNIVEIDPERMDRDEYCIVKVLPWNRD